jgi:hypothetical protein
VASPDLGDADRMAQDRRGIDVGVVSPGEPEDQSRTLARVARRELLALLCP